MLDALKRYANWLHLQWPQGQVEKLPELSETGETSLAGVYVVGDLRGIPLLKFSIDSGARTVRHIAADKSFEAARSANDGALDLVIIGGGVSGMAAAIEAKKLGLNHVVLEASEPFSTIINFPKGKPIYTYPKDMKPGSDLTVSAEIKEPLVEELRRQTADVKTRASFAETIKKKGKLLEVVLRKEESLLARRVIVAIGRSGNFRKLGVPGEELDKVYNRLHDPKDHAGKRCVVVGGGDSAMETAIALTKAGSDVTISYRSKEFSRAKPENIEMVQRLAIDPSAPAAVKTPVSERITTASGAFISEETGGERKVGKLRLMLGSKIKKISAGEITIANAEGQDETFGNDVVFAMIGREAPLPFFRRSGIRITGEWTPGRVASLVVALLAMTFVYHWKKTGIGGFEHIPLMRSVVKIGDVFATKGWFPYNVTAAWAAEASPLVKTLKVTLTEPGFYYSLVYCVLIFVFGLKRIARRQTPYVRLQTWTLFAFQVIPLFLLPYIVLPWLGHAGLFDGGFMKTAADALFPLANYGHGREYWRAFGLILAWPLFFWNVFTSQPMWTWLAISFVQTFVIIPLIIYKWGKGAYCGWICSCGALAETLGDAHRHKMPHGKAANRLNFAGQAILAVSFLLLIFRILGWAHVGWAEHAYNVVFHDLPLFNYVWFVDLFLAGIIGVGLYFHFSGRVWCRFFCPLAALMHVYARFSKFAILPEKKKCISCNVCTSVCHMGIDIMNFANKGLAMKDPECVRCSACVQSCPTGVLQFGEADKKGAPIKFDYLAASPVRMKEGAAKPH